MVELLIGALLLIGGLVLGAGTALAVLCAVIVRAAAVANPFVPPSPERADTTPSAPSVPGPSTPAVLPGGDSAMPEAAGPADEPSGTKTRQKARCAFCEAARAALGLTAKALTGK